jgi:hypothetical protein
MDWIEEMVNRYRELKDRKKLNLSTDTFRQICEKVEREFEKRNISLANFDIAKLIKSGASEYENLKIINDELNKRFGFTILNQKLIDFWIKKENEYRELKKRILSSKIDINDYFKDYERELLTFLNTKTKLFIVIGGRGIGKTYNTERILKKNKVEYEMVRGHITPLRLYSILYENRNGLIVFDDVDLFDSDENVSILLSSTDESGYVRWDTSKELPEGIEKEFVFSGKIIIITNKFEIDSAVKEALWDRALKIDFDKNLTRNKMIEMILVLAKKHKCVDVVDWLFYNKIDITFRDYQKLKELYFANKKEWRDLAESFMLNEIDEELNETDKIILNIMREHTDKSNNQKAKLFREETGKSRWTFYKHLRKLRKLGLIRG